GAARPGHLRAVATVCLKLFNIIRPARAYFGQKDAQQAAVVTRMAADLDLEIEIRVVPTVRDEDGLALSSRNARLSPEQRAVALALPRALAAGAAAGRDGGSAVDTARSMLEAAEGLEIDYVEEARLNATRLLLAAVTVGGTRLIDNVPLAHRETERSP
ncbi:MAG: pantoate--beta-alanine ligase, partial [Gaiellales bacterium]